MSESELSFTRLAAVAVANERPAPHTVHLLVVYDGEPASWSSVDLARASRQADGVLVTDGAIVEDDGGAPGMGLWHSRDCDRGPS